MSEKNNDEKTIGDILLGNAVKTEEKAEVKEDESLISKVRGLFSGKSDKEGSQEPQKVTEESNNETKAAEIKEDSKADTTNEKTECYESINNDENQEDPKVNEEKAKSNEESKIIGIKDETKKDCNEDKKETACEPKETEDEVKSETIVEANVDSTESETKDEIDVEQQETENQTETTVGDLMNENESSKDSSETETKEEASVEQQESKIEVKENETKSEECGESETVCQKVEDKSDAECTEVKTNDDETAESQVEQNINGEGDVKVKESQMEVKEEIVDNSTEEKTIGDILLAADNENQEKEFENNTEDIKIEEKTEIVEVNEAESDKLVEEVPSDSLACEITANEESNNVTIQNCAIEISASDFFVPIDCTKVEESTESDETVTVPEVRSLTPTVVEENNEQTDNENVEVKAETEMVEDDAQMKAEIDTRINSLVDSLLDCKEVTPEEEASSAESNLLREITCKKYKITEAAFDLSHQFFNEHQENDLISNSMLSSVISESIKDRNDVNATQNHIDSALKAIDSDNDDKINFDEFIRFLYLFFSSKNNFRQRVFRVLECQFSSGTLNNDEANDTKKFLDNFYSMKEETRNIFTQILEKLTSSIGKKSDSENINFNEFSTQVATDLEESLFVKFE